MKLSALVGTARKLFGERSRRAWMGRSRAHIEFRAISAEEYGEFVAHLRAGLERLREARWFEVNPHTRRVVVAFREDAYTLGRLVAIVEESERSAGVLHRPFREGVAEHPADLEAAERVLFELGTNVIGFAVGSVLRLTPVPASRLAGSVASVLTIVRGSPRLRRSLDARLGPERADLAMGVITGAALGFAQRPSSSLVEIVHKAALHRELQARRAAWLQREAELHAVCTTYHASELEVPARPVPLPRGPIEEYADLAWVVSLGGFVVSFITTRSFQRAVAALFGALPKPARLGRDVFAAELGRLLASRGCLVMDPEALRRLDRVDCLVLQGDLVPRDRFEVGEVIVTGSLEALEIRRIVGRLFDPERPLDVTQRDGYWLGPTRLASGRLDEELGNRVTSLARRGGLVLMLARAGVPLGVVEIHVIPQTGIDELIAAAHQAQMRVVISSADEAVLQGLPADDTIPEGADMPAGIQRLQREGHVVCVVATGSSPGLATSDCSIGLVRPGERVPSSAHVVCRDDLSDVRFLIQACVAARRISKQSVNISLGAATVGALVSAGGIVPLSTRRVIFVVNVASLYAMLTGYRTVSTLAREKLPRPRDRTPWHALDPEGVLVQLDTGPEGLTRREALERYRPPPAPRSSLGELAEAVTDELFSPLAPLLAAGAGLSAVVGSVGDAGMVGAVVALNALVGGVQRFRTERAIRDLARTARRRARVMRGGDIIELDASELVRGDIVLLGAGDVVPADCRLLDCESLEVDASSLTGESLPVKKAPNPSLDAQVADRSSMVYEGTSIASGHARAVVVAIGDDTEARRGGGVSRRDAGPGGVERRLRSLIDLTGPVALGAGAGLVTVGLLRGRKFEEMVGAGVSLAVASVPEGLPLLATAAQLAAAERLSRRGALVRNARSIEALGRVNVLCVDKTGTVTQGRIELSFVSDGSSSEPAHELADGRTQVLAAALRATPDPTRGSVHTDPTDAALTRASVRLAVRPEHGCPGWRRVSELAFEAGRGYHAVLAQTSDGNLLSVKGAPEAIVPRCSRWRRGGKTEDLDAAATSTLSSAAAQLARRGLRVLAVAESAADGEERLEPGRLAGLTFVGYMAFSDPVRPSAAGAIADLRTIGVRTIMITGDHPSTAEAIAAELDLARGMTVLTGAELTVLSDDELLDMIDSVAVFARVTPSQKVRVVRALQRAGYVVAMVGDGANDAPAIRLANVGIAIGEQSTSAARSAADIILTDERIETLVSAIVEGRAMWMSVRDAVSILIGGNLGEIGFTLAAGLFSGRSPLNARQLLLVNLLTDVAPAMAIALRPPSEARLERLAQEGPDASLGQPLTREIAQRAVVTGAGAGAAWLISRLTGDAERASTTSLLALVGTQLGQTLISGGTSRPVITTSLASALVLAAIVQTPGVSQMFGCRPVGPIAWATAIGSSAGATALARAIPELGELLAEWIAPALRPPPPPSGAISERPRLELDQSPNSRRQLN